MPKVRRFAEAVGASMVGYYACKLVDYVMRLIFD